VDSSSRPSRAKAHSPLRRRAALAGLALALTAGCGQDDRPGVTVTNAQSDVVFGNQATPTPAATPQQPNIGPQGPAPLPPPSIPRLPDPPGFNNPTGFPTDDSGPPAKPKLCPGPPLFATAPEPATITVDGQPKPGFYLWQSITEQDLGSNIKSKTAKYTNYEVKNISPVTSRPNPTGAPTETFTYDVVAPVGQGNVRTITYQVKQNAIFRDVATGNLGTPTRIGEPDAGVSIKKEVLRDAAGEVVSTFEPATPVLILPLPIAGGASFTGSGTDAVNGSSLTISGTVVGPSRVSTCTGFVQGYRVEGTVSSTAGGESTTSDQAFTVETQGGGLVIASEATPTGSKFKQLSVIGAHVPAKAPREIPKEEAL
jgi:hypothetical protein